MKIVYAIRAVFICVVLMLVLMLYANPDVKPNWIVFVLITLVYGVLELFYYIEREE